MSRVKAHPIGLPRRLLAEAVGTALLVTVVVGSGIAAARLSPTDIGLQLLENSTATVFGLAVLILMFGPVSGAHFNPVVTLADWVLGRRRGTGITGAMVGPYLAAQIVGGIGGAILANVMFDLPAVQISTTDRATTGHGIGEIVATAGLVALIFLLARTGRHALSAAAVGAYIGAAYWFTSSTSFANPAVTIGRIFSDTFAGIAPASVPLYLGAQVIGAAIGVGLVLALFPETLATTTTAAAVTVIPVHRSSEPGDLMSTAPAVLFVCVHNAGRSQMAAGYLTALTDGKIEVRSAGSIPGDQVNPVAILAMAEEGIDISTQTPKVLTTESVQASDVVITMGCGDTCPIYPGKRYEDWDLEDPAGKGIATVRRVRDDIRSRVENLISELLPAGA